MSVASSGRADVITSDRGLVLVAHGLGAVPDSVLVRKLRRFRGATLSICGFDEKYLAVVAHGRDQQAFSSRMLAFDWEARRADVVA